MAVRNLQQVLNKQTVRSQLPSLGEQAVQDHNKHVLKATWIAHMPAADTWETLTTLSST